MSPRGSSAPAFSGPRPISRDKILRPPAGGAAFATAPPPAGRATHIQEEQGWWWVRHKDRRDLDRSEVGRAWCVWAECEIARGGHVSSSGDGATPEIPSDGGSCTTPRASTSMHTCHNAFRPVRPARVSFRGACPRSLVSALAHARPLHVRAERPLPNHP